MNEEATFQITAEETKDKTYAYETLETLASFAKRHEMKMISVGEICFEFFEKPHAPLVKAPTVEELLAQEGMPPDEELLYASSDYYDELMAQKEEGAKPPVTP